VQQNLAAIIRIGLTLDETGRFQPIGQLDGSVVAQREAICQLANGRPAVRRQPFEREQTLVLLRLDPVLSCLHFAELKEMAKLAAKLRQGSIVVQIDVHCYIVARYVFAMRASGTLIGPRCPAACDFRLLRRKQWPSKCLSETEIRALRPAREEKA
jgi:hypothetical protein